jgi:hypothetical protein
MSSKSAGDRDVFSRRHGSDQCGALGIIHAAYRMMRPISALFTKKVLTGGGNQTTGFKF